MNPEVKKLWVDALKSGEYVQGTGALQQGRKFCCLGVLCVLAVGAGVELNIRRDSSEKYFFDGLGWFLPPAVQEWAGLDAGNPWDGGNNTLSFQNDNNTSFTQIADLIEEHF